jgi:predicted 3-demethylubiquinone-9 3-methyltransferase (glyoxalase superfamily)
LSKPRLAIRRSGEKEDSMQRIAPMLWYDDDAEEAARFYCSIFKNSKITGKSSYGEGGPGPKGKVMLVTFELDGQEFTALNGGPQFPFTEAISLVVNCKDQKEIDDYWEKLTSGGGKPVQCGWLKDKYGVSWQVVPTIISELMSDDDPAKRDRVMAAVMKMVKPDIAAMKAAAAGK